MNTPCSAPDAGPDAVPCRAGRGGRGEASFTFLDSKCFLPGPQHPESPVAVRLAERGHRRPWAGSRPPVPSAGAALRQKTGLGANGMRAWAPAALSSSSGLGRPGGSDEFGAAPAPCRPLPHLTGGQTQVSRGSSPRPVPPQRSGPRNQAAAADRVHRRLLCALCRLPATLQGQGPFLILQTRA